LPFLAPLCGLSHRLSYDPPHCCSGSILLLAYILFRVLSSLIPTGSTSVVPSLGLPLPSSRHQPIAALCVSKFPNFDTFASMVFHTPSTLFAALSLVDLFHSTATSRVSLQGFHPHLRLIKLVALPLTLSSFLRTRLKAVAHFLQLARPRPQGLLPSVNLYSPNLAVSQTREPIPSWLFPPPGFHPKQRSSAFTLFAAFYLTPRPSLSSASLVFGDRYLDWLVSPETADLLEVLCLPTT